MLRKALIMKLFDAFSIQRWNDQVRPLDLVEMDKHAHKMAIAWYLARVEEDQGHTIDWHALIQGGIFDLLRRIILSDIKSPVYRRIRQDHPQTFADLSAWVLQQLEPLVAAPIYDDLKTYLLTPPNNDTLVERILSAAHFESSHWEFQIIRRISPNERQTNRIDRLMRTELEPHLELQGMRKITAGTLLSDKGGIADFIDLIGHLRFQVRWAQTPRVPRTSVLGHSMLVAVLSYFLTCQLTPCKRRIYNNFFGGLFHDLPESVTRDIVSPIKSAIPEFSGVLANIEKTLMEEEIYPMIPDDYAQEIRYFTQDEFTSRITINHTITSTTTDDINEHHNQDDKNPIDGEIIRAADHLAAYAEAYKSTQSGIRTPQLEEGLKTKDRYKDKTIGGINIGTIYADFD